MQERKRHEETNHVEQKSKTCDKAFPSTMEVLMHTESEHSKNIKEDQKENKSLSQTHNIKEDTLSVQAVHNVPGLWLTPWSGRRTALHRAMDMWSDIFPVYCMPRDFVL